MKKAISIGIALASVTLFGVAYAESAQSAYLTAVKTSGEYVNGGTVTFCVKATRDNVTEGGFIVKAEGLELVSSKVEGGNFASNTATFSGVSVAKDGIVASFTYKVTAKTGENVRFAISEHEDYPKAVDPIPVTGIVVEGSSASNTQSAPATSSTNSSNSSNVTGGSSNSATGNPVTGIASAVVPAVLVSTAAVVAARKRKQ